MADETRLARHETREALAMIRPDDIGRISAGWDADTDFDALPPRLVDVTDADVASADLFQGDEGEGDGELREFEPAIDAFPVYKGALLHFQEIEQKPRAVRIDTPKTYQGFGVDKALREIERRTQDLRRAIEQHEADHHGAKVAPMRQWEEIIGALEAISDLHASKSGGEAVAKLPQIPLTVPDHAKDHVKCWRDGDNVIVSLEFAMPDGSHRIATMGQKQHLDEESVVGWAEQHGYDPITVLGVAPVLASVATGKRLVRDAAAAAVNAQSRHDVQRMTDADEEPVVMIGLGNKSAPLAALMYLHQRADSGDAAAQRELDIMEKAAKTPIGQRVAAPVLAEARRRLAHGRSKKSGHDDHYAKLSAFV